MINPKNVIKLLFDTMDYHFNCNQTQPSDDDFELSDQLLDLIKTLSTTNLHSVKYELSLTKDKYENDEEYGNKNDAIKRSKVKTKLNSLSLEEMKEIINKTKNWSFNTIKKK